MKVCSQINSNHPCINELLIGLLNLCQLFPLVDAVFETPSVVEKEKFVKKYLHSCYLPGGINISLKALQVPLHIVIRIWWNSLVELAYSLKIFTCSRENSLSLIFSVGMNLNHTRYLELRIIRTIYTFYCCLLLRNIKNFIPLVIQYIFCLPYCFLLYGIFF